MHLFQCKRYCDLLFVHVRFAMHWNTPNNWDSLFDSRPGWHATAPSTWSWLTGIAGSFLRSTWWRHQIETFSALQVTGGFPSQRPVRRIFDVVFDLHRSKRLSKQSRRRWFEKPSRSLWRHFNGTRPCWMLKIKSSHAPANMLGQRGQRASYVQVQGINI